MRLISLKKAGIMLVLTGLSLGSVSCATPLPPQLENRTLWLKKDLTGFYYQYEGCVKKLLGVCVSKKMKVDDYLFSDKEKMKLFYDKNFVLKKSISI